MSKTLAKINKYIEFITTKVKILYKEKVFRKNGNKLKYILEESKDSTDLIVIFSGIPRPGIKARYNYGRTLAKINANKLFILDDLGYDQRGGFYLGKNKNFYVEKSSIELIKIMKKDLRIKRTFYVGSSKGGFASLYFGLRDKASIIIAGGPTFNVGTYLTKGRFKTNTLPYIMGDNYTEKDIAYLNGLLKNVIKENKDNDCKIHLHYSPHEPRYEQHVKELITELKNKDISFTEDLGEYTDHIDISLHFPSYLVNMLKKEMQ